MFGALFEPPPHAASNNDSVSAWRVRNFTGFQIRKSVDDLNFISVRYKEPMMALVDRQVIPAALTAYLDFLN